MAKKSRLHTYTQCYQNIELFEESDGLQRSGLIAVYRHSYGNMPKYFAWLYDGGLHRTDGPARIYYNGGVEWHFCGEYIEVKSQRKFEKWMCDNL